MILLIYILVSILDAQTTLLSHDVHEQNIIVSYLKKNHGVLGIIILKVVSSVLFGIAYCLDVIGLNTALLLISIMLLIVIRNIWVYFNVRG